MFALGASGYLIKPFGENELIRHISFLAEKAGNKTVSGKTA
jgi:DNA-binding response OmpR family regulator